MFGFRSNQPGVRGVTPIDIHHGMHRATALAALPRAEADISATQAKRRKLKVGRLSS